MPNATAIWGDRGTCQTTGCYASVGGTKNGNGNGLVKAYSVTTPDYPNESFDAWQQLSLAEMIEGRYYDFAPAGYGGGAWSLLGGFNVPKTAAGDVLIRTAYPGSTAVEEQGAMLFEIGKGNPAYNNTAAYWGGLNTEEAVGLDRKIDDGVITTGKVWVFRDRSTATDGDCTSGESWNWSKPVTPVLTATPNVTDTKRDCLLWLYW